LIVVSGGGVGVVLAFYINLIGYSHITDPSWLGEVLAWITAAVLFVILGFLTVKLQKFMIILGSAAIGAFLILIGPLLILESALNSGLPDWAQWIFFAFYTVLWICGVLVQVSIAHAHAHMLTRLFMIH
jgi:hypothetical protein